MNLTTAPSLWATTGLGVLCGLGAPTLAGLATVLVLGVLVVGQRLDRWLYGRAGIKNDDRE
ncbi:MAG: MgtC/SapB family protein [Reyranellales bacterium]